MVGGSGRFLVLVGAVWWIAVAASERTAREGDGTTLVQGAHYERAANRTSICLHNPFTRCFVHLAGERLEPVYGWVNVSGMEPEEELARAQLRALGKMANDFPHNETLSFEVILSEETAMVTLSVDEAAVMWDAENYTVEEQDGIGSERLDKYLEKQNLTAFLGSRGDVLGRWRNISEAAHELDKAGNANVTFVYHAETAVFECSVTALVPVYFHINLTCEGSPGSEHAVVGWTESEEAATQTMRWTDPRCAVDGANCTVESTGEWRRVLGPDIVGEIVIVSVRGSDLGTSVTVSLFVAALISVLLACAYYRFRSTLRSRRAVSIGYVRDFT
ncbi:pr70.2 [rat cytomegalovirus strain Maastricht]|uniref:Pr70.2 n=1 Tax=Rat cytomegalovirus (strain Maastricht) TaxID=79700 RepID=Q9DWD2_RCMVM|nr:pr70.2 [rat cytomegalovirus strain Maastricht]AAF99158.1 pr70.2 [rat cytomegalovirus strain Maastricht]WEG71988.1 membrane protein m71.1 [Murid betaherpesvirus 2]